MLKKCVLTLALVALVSTVAHAEPQTYQLDGNHSTVGFTVRHMAISKVRGSFDDVDGSFTIDPADSSSWSCQAVIQVASIDTDNEKRDGHLRSSDFFNADSFPTITFQSTKITPKGGGMFEVQGDFTMRGVTKAITLQAEMTGAITDPWGNNRIGVELTGEIDRMDYGVNWNNVMETGGLVVSHEVQLNIEAEGVYKPE